MPMKMKTLLKTNWTALFLTGLLVLGAGAADIPSYPQADWEVLFDGEKVSGLRGYRRTEFPWNCWKIEDGVLKTVPGKKDRVDLVTIRQYEDFQLEFEWAAKGSSNGGVFYHAQETTGPIWHTAPEYQLLDDGGHHDGKNPKTSAGALYAMKAPNIDKILAPLQSFNRSKIVCNKGHVEHWLNGMLVVEYDWDGEEVRELIQTSKFKDKPKFMQFGKGHVGFQHHGEEIWLRNIRITVLKGS